MRDYDTTAGDLRGVAAGLRGLCTLTYSSAARACDNAADAIEELVAERDKALNRLCELCGVCSEKSRSPMECEIAGFVEPPKEENAHD